MQIGIFAKTFVRPTLTDTLDAVAAHGIRCVQFNWSCAGLPGMPDRIDPRRAEHVRAATQERNITIAAVSGTFNMIHPDQQQRRDGLRRLRVIAEACHAIGTGVITVCTGTRDPEDMWRRHPDNTTPAAWRDLLATMTRAVRIAEEHHVTLAFEPEVANVVDSAFKGRQLLDQIDAPNLKVVMDGANLFHAGDLPRMREILDEAIDLLGAEIVLAHAKDLSHDGEAGREAAGTGMLDYHCYLAALRRVGFRGPVILHALTEQQVDRSVAFLREKGVRLDGEA